MIAGRRTINEFVKRWTAPGSGREESQTQTFWEDLLEECMGVESPRKLLRFEYPVHGFLPQKKRNVDRSIDVLYPDMQVLIEQKSRGIDLDKAEVIVEDIGPETPYEQGKWYAENLPLSLRPRWIIVCNFDEFRIHDLEVDRPARNFESVMLKDLPREANRLGFLVDERDSRTAAERQLSVKAGETVASLYKRLSSRYLNIEDDPFERHSLNVLITRLVFIMFAEDSGLLPDDTIWRYLNEVPVDSINIALQRLFDVLDTPKEIRSRYLPEFLASLPYVDGGLFDKSTEIAIPQFDLACRLTLIEESARSVNWSDISPTIFGATFESTLNPETRRSGGMHYTSVENIHRVIDPLFVREFHGELNDIQLLDVPRDRVAALNRFWDKLAGIQIMDPACGSGNFLTESYLELRKMENEVIKHLQALGAYEVPQGESPIRVSINQLHGIEINDFAVSVARTALWIAERQMMEVSKEELGIEGIDYFPLSHTENIRCANALTTDWNDVISADECDYVIGNPPFAGARTMKKTKKADMKAVFGEKFRGVGDLDYVTAWFMKAAQYASGGHPRVAFVATNSISQGVQVALLWKPLREMGYDIDFAHDTFRWDNEATIKARVHCVIIGFSKSYTGDRVIFHHESPNSHSVAIVVPHINGYVRAEEDVFIYDRDNPLCDVPKMRSGNKPIDGGNYILNKKQVGEFERMEPGAMRFIHPYIGGDEFLRNKMRWILWFGDASEDDLMDLPWCRERIAAVKDHRLSSTSEPTRKLAERPTRYHIETIPKGPSIVVPEVSSEKRIYMPFGFVGPEVFCSNKLKVLIGGNLYEYGVLQSSVHRTWTDYVGGRLETRNDYSNTLVYNNFVWPAPLSSSRERVERAAQGVLDARDQFPTRTLEELYNADKMPASLKAAHARLDEAVKAAYGLAEDASDQMVWNHLKRLYLAKISTIKD